MATYVTDGKGNRYERRYDSKTKTYTDHYVGKARGDEAKGNPDANSGWKPSGSSSSSRSSSGSSSRSSRSSSSSSKSSSKGYAYVDKYGFTHVVKDYETAKKYAAPGTKVYDYHGSYSGGYARNEKGGRYTLPLPGAVPFGNSKSGVDTYGGGDYIGGVSTPSASIPSIPKLDPGTLSYFDRNYGGIDAYAASQAKRYQDAVNRGDADLIQRLQADAARVGYSLPSLSPNQPIAPTPIQPLVEEIPEIPYAQVPTPYIDFEQPFVYQPYQYTPPPITMTSDGSDSWTPTLSAVNQWYSRQDQLRNDYLNQKYRDQVLAQQQAELDWEKELYNSPYQKALRDLALQQAQAELQATRALEAQRIAAANRPSSSTQSTTQSASSGSLSNTQQYQVANQYITQNLSNYKRPIDFAAQVKRDTEAGKINPSVAAKIFDVLQDLYPTEEAMYQTLSTWGK